MPLRVRALLLGLCFVMAATPASAQSFVVVVNAGNSLSTIAKEDLSRIFLKRVPDWPGGGAALPVDLPLNNPTRAGFTSRVHGRSVFAVRAFWQQQIFAARDVPPAEKINERDVMEFVRQNPGAVGYVPADMPLVPGVKAIQVRGVAP